MDRQARIMWDFLEAAFRTGALDEFLRLSYTLTDRKYEVHYNIYEDLENYLMDLDDMKHIEDIFNIFYETLEALTDTEILEGLKTILSVLNPWIEQIMTGIDKNKISLGETGKMLQETFPKLKKAFGALFTIVSNVWTDAKNSRSVEEYGAFTGNLLNRWSTYVNTHKTIGDAPVSQFMSSVFHSVDKNEVRQMSETLVHSFLDQGPKPVKWMASIMMERAKNRLTKKA